MPLRVFNFNVEVGNVMSQRSITAKAKTAFKTFGKYAQKFLMFVFEELIIFAKDFWAACKFMCTNDKNQWWSAAKRNWWKFVKYFGVLFVFFGLNLSLGTIGFILGALIISKILSVTLPLLDKRIKSIEQRDNSEATKSRKTYTILRILQILLPVVALFVAVSHWWLLVPGLIMMFFGGFIDHKHREGKKQEKDYGHSLNENKFKDTNDKKNEKENMDNNFHFGKFENNIPSDVINTISDNRMKQEVIKDVGGSIFNKIKDSLKDFFMASPNLENDKKVEIK